MNTEIFLCTHAKDFPWLKYCLRSIAKFATGFAGVTIVVPLADFLLLQTLVEETVPDLGFHVQCFTGEEWPGLGMLWHMNEIMHADCYCPGADFIAHLDPDCVFTAPVSPATFMVSSPSTLNHQPSTLQQQPILRFEKFSIIGLRHPPVLRWQECTARCLPFPVENETMRCHPSVYHRALYAAARNQMVLKTGQPVPAYIRSCQNTFPQGFCEFVTLGNVALQLFRHLYFPIEQLNDHVIPSNHLQQFWSHGALDQPQPIFVLGEQKVVVPIEMIKQLGLA
jgi:hypothetical protein